ncbi:hypothetical protein BV20DRAFT_1126451 [Pilatotrama ljubarskyi]|nr:hypothetical protein BV20DRAFT_1126451 [Pilatotrama ljubarskyi]
MTSLHKYAARRHHVFFYSADPTIPTGMPVEEAAALSTSQLYPEHPECSAPIDEQIYDPMGLVEEIAREYARLRSELGPKPSAGPSILDEKALRRKRRKEQAEQYRRELAIFVDQYRKLVKHAAYVDSVWKHMEESGYFDDHEDDEDDVEVEIQNTDDSPTSSASGAHVVAEPHSCAQDDLFVEGSSKEGRNRQVAR